MEELLALLESAGTVAVGMCARTSDAASRRRAILGCQALLDRVKVAQARLMADATANKDWVGTGHRGMADWLSGTTKSSYGDAKRKEKLGSALGKSKPLDDAVAEGALSADAAEALADTVNHPPENATDEDVADLVDAVKGASPRDAKQAADRWRELLSEETEEQAAARRFAQRSVTTTVPIDGMSTTSITLPVLEMRQLLNALDHAAGEPAEHDPRSNSQRLADGAIALAQRYAAGQVTGGRANPNILITISAEAFAGLTEDPGHTACGDRIPAHVVRELARNATLQRVVMAGSKVLDLGRQVRYATHDQYQALVARDGCCRWGECTIPAAWCDVDHVQEWAKGGNSDIDWEWLLCRHHHTQRHQPGVRLLGNANTARIQLVDGTVVPCPPKGAGNRKPEPVRRRQRSSPPGHAPPGQETFDVA